MKLKVNNVEFAYNSIPVLENVSMELNPAEVLGIVGPNGTGKSTLIRCIDQILNPKSGSILLDNHNISKMTRMEIARKMGYVPQSITGVFPASVIDTVLMGRRPYLGWKSGKEDLDYVLEVLELLGMMEFAMRDINEISGGQQQKVLIARALAQKANILLLDEPTSNLDIRHQLEVMEIMKNIVKDKGISAIMALHDLNLASRYADRIVMMKDGKIFAAGNPASVLTVENIKQVYGVRALVKDDGKRPYIIPIEPVTG
ncbi:Vitamin B12 ABC transporter, ATPase component BtuD [Methanosarcina horonobensis HB-1 = JCM 15518]|uniref:Cobalamin import ATP-binding protein BtuD n=1 Tax=Methanosarcina horonobensis HB-1 = JCM 15518 TaxID=1434110 RepID=A0A0E3SGI6_9EURY|nr:ABC transporter ATP-binding protein [Methanosarcina horonobensis]AKB78668.1 Vitamin B12 ABC transporter, ATPase component BtuD [Methanosarcina horonobensis HB-1 = JCM 15518]